MRVNHHFDRTLKRYNIKLVKNLNSKAKTNLCDTCIRCTTPKMSYFFTDSKYFVFLHQTVSFLQ